MQCPLLQAFGALPGESLFDGDSIIQHLYLEREMYIRGDLYQILCSYGELHRKAIDHFLASCITMPSKIQWFLASNTNTHVGLLPKTCCT
jgi:hypothetical protein